METTQRFTFGDALEALKNGERVARKGWNGKGMWLTLVNPADDYVEQAGPVFAVEGLLDNFEEALGCGIHPTIAMRTANGDFVLGWLASQTDMLAEDWEIV